MQPSAGCKCGQGFLVANSARVPNGGDVNLSLETSGADAHALTSTLQVAKVTRPLLSVTKITLSGKLHVVCRKDVAMILDDNQQVLAKFHRRGGGYTAIMRVRNPKFGPFARPAR